MDHVVAALQKREKQMLIDLKKILDNNSIKFCLAWGSILGCVRHNGFIPWDDDVDIFIDGKDYQKLKYVFESQDTGDLILQDAFNTPNYPFCFPKIVDKNSVLVERGIKDIKYKSGVYIDIFPVFGAPNNSLLRKLTLINRYIKYGILRARYNTTGLLHICSYLFSVKHINKSLYKIYSRGIGSSKLCCEPTSFDNKTFFPSNIMHDIIFKDFCGVNMPIPKKYDEYLKHFYGDYMKLPPIEQRTSNHDIFELIIDGEKLI